MKACPCWVFEYNVKLNNNYFISQLNKGVFDLKYYINGYVMDVICSCGYGIDIESVKNPNHPIVVNATKIFGIDLDITKVLGFVWPQLGKVAGTFKYSIQMLSIFFGKLSEKLN